jgi:hypothetical protein
MKWNSFGRVFLWSAGFLLILTTTTSTLFAALFDNTVGTVPELNPTTVGSALAFVAGGYLLLLSKFRRK